MCYDFSELPPHVVTIVLLYLKLKDFKQAVQTCKSWYYASCDPAITKKLSLSLPYDTTNIDFVTRPCGKLHFHQTNFNNFKSHNLFFLFGNHVTELELHGCVLRTTKLYEMFIWLSNLKIIKLFYAEKCYRPDQNFYNFKKFKFHQPAIAENLGRVKYLSVRVITKHLNAAKLLFAYCTNLETLHWNDDVIVNVNQNDFLLNFLLDPKQNPVIQRVSELVIQSVDRTVNGVFFQKLIDLGNISIQTLDLKKIAYDYYDPRFKEFCKTYRFLTTYRMNGCNNAQLRDVSCYMQNLQRLELEKVDATNLYEIANLRNLQILCLSRIDSCRDSVLIALVECKLPQLESLALDKISHKALKAICENLKHLRSLELSDIATYDCQSIFRYMSKLKYLKLRFNSPPLDQSKDFIDLNKYNISKLIELEFLYVSCYVPGITIDYIRMLPNLKSVHHMRFCNSTAVHNLAVEEIVNEPMEHTMSSTYNICDFPNYFETIS